MRETGTAQATIALGPGESINAAVDVEAFWLSEPDPEIDQPPHLAWEVTVIARGPPGSTLRIEDDDIRETSVTTRQSCTYCESRKSAHSGLQWVECGDRLHCSTRRTIKLENESNATIEAEILADAELFCSNSVEFAVDVTFYDSVLNPGRVGKE